MPQPLLSICIPTFNRAETLRLTLGSTLAQIAQFGDEVELVVSDNCSSDHTQEVIAEAQRHGQFRAHRNDFNTGIKNFFIATNQLARGKYCWILGDDDIIINGRLGEIVGLLKKYPEYDYIFANNDLKAMSKIKKIISKHKSFYKPLAKDCLLTDFDTKFLERWEDLIALPSKKVFALGTGIVTHILKRELWQEHSARFEMNPPNHMYRLGGIFPHLRTVISAMRGKPIIYLGNPCTIMGAGESENTWGQYVDIFFTFPLVELLDLYIELGIDRHLIHTYQDSLLSHCGLTIPNMFLKLKNEGMAGNEFMAKKLDEFIKRFPVKNMYWAKENNNAMQMEFHPDLNF